MIHEVSFTLILDGLARKYWRATCTCATWEAVTATYNTALAKARAHERAGR